MFGRFVTALATISVAITVALAVPVSQLRIVSVMKSCCCPDPSNCHCPDHSKTKSTESTMRACHNEQQVSVTPQMPAFEPPVVTIASVDVPTTTHSIDTVDEPHPAPPPQRPDAPS